MSGYSPTDAHIYSPEGRKRWWRAGGSECKAEEVEGEISAPGSSLDQGLFFFLSLFPAPPFPLIAASASDRNLLEKKPEQAVTPLHQPLLIERSSDMNLEGFFFFFSHFEQWFTHTNGLTFNHIGKYIPGVKLLWLFPKCDPKEEELVMEDYALKIILQMHM